jgi:2-polyprenyl-6-methoxyphenol hydroxylase-like FAD-dependent oxidoreductase
MVTDVVIAGAGIGGLTLALALRRRGVSVRCLERAVDLEGGGAGLSLAPNAMRGSRQLGLSGAALAAGEVITRAAILRSGRCCAADGVMSRIANIYQPSVRGQRIG